MDVAAFDTADYAGSAACGSCVHVKGPKGEVTVQAEVKQASGDPEIISYETASLDASSTGALTGMIKAGSDNVTLKIVAPHTAKETDQLVAGAYSAQVSFRISPAL